MLVQDQFNTFLANKHFRCLLQLFVLFLYLFLYLFLTFLFLFLRILLDLLMFIFLLLLVPSFSHGDGFLLFPVIGATTCSNHGVELCNHDSTLCNGSKFTPDKLIDKMAEG